MNIASELDSEIRAKAEAMHIDFDTTVAALLRMGLEEQNKREREIEELREQSDRTDDPQFRKQIGDKLGSVIFGR